MTPKRRVINLSWFFFFIKLFGKIVWRPPLYSVGDDCSIFHSPWKPCEPLIVSRPLPPRRGILTGPFHESNFISRSRSVSRVFFFNLIWCSRRTGLTGSWSCSTGWRVRRTCYSWYRRALFGLCPARSEKDVLRDRWVLGHIYSLLCLKSVPWEEGRMSHS